MADKKTIDEDTKLKAFALFTMAQHHYAECRKYEEQMAAMLLYTEEDRPYMGSLSDEIYNENGSFERGLKHEGFSVAKPKRAA